MVVAAATESGKRIFWVTSKFFWQMPAAKMKKSLFKRINEIDSVQRDEVPESCFLPIMGRVSRSKQF